MNKGFTLIELMVTVGILVFVLGITLADHKKFGGQIMLRNLAYELGLVIRQAQTYGVSVRNVSGDTSQLYDVPYGVHFYSDTDYLLFEDKNRNGKYDADNLEQDGGAFHIGNHYKINNLSVTCDGTESDVSTLDITFQRPEPDAFIRHDGLSELCERAEIELISPRDDIMRVVVSVSGQISVTK